MSKGEANISSFGKIVRIIFKETDLFPEKKSDLFLNSLQELTGKNREQLIWEAVQLLWLEEVDDEK